MKIIRFCICKWLHSIYFITNYNSNFKGTRRITYRHFSIDMSSFWVQKRWLNKIHFRFGSHSLNARMVSIQHEENLKKILFGYCKILPISLIRPRNKGNQRYSEAVFIFVLNSIFWVYLILNAWTFLLFVIYTN